MFCLVNANITALKCVIVILILLLTLCGVVLFLNIFLSRFNKSLENILEKGIIVDNLNIHISVYSKYGCIMYME